MVDRTIDDELARVLQADTCTGCGACCVIDAGLRMRPNEAGYLRPTRVGAADTGQSSAAVAAEFRAGCPAVRVVSPRPSPSGVRHHSTLGPHLGVWAAWASDPEIRTQGSSGGVITALGRWLLETGRSSRVLGATVDREDPRRTVATIVSDPDGMMATAGSRYAPVAVAAEPSAHEPGTAVVGKPCEVAAIRARSAVRGSDSPILISFFCAGTPSQGATDDVLRSLGIDGDQPLHDLWYRGRGWPGRFTAVTAEGDRSTSYDESWGRHLGPTIQWRCKLCPDGVGESADLASCDWWETDDRGYPLFSEGDGRSGLVARTSRGLTLIEEAMAAGVIHAEPIDADALMKVQPFQRRRREELLGRLIGTRAAGRAVPRYRGFGLWWSAVRSPLRTLRAARGTWGRARAARALAARPSPH